MKHGTIVTLALLLTILSGCAPTIYIPVEEPEQLASINTLAPLGAVKMTTNDGEVHKPSYIHVTPDTTFWKGSRKTSQLEAVATSELREIQLKSRRNRTGMIIGGSLGFVSGFISPLTITADCVTAEPCGTGPYLGASLVFGAISGGLWGWVGSRIGSKTVPRRVYDLESLKE